ncbi:universal stress protein [Oceanithermus sp.]
MKILHPTDFSDASMKALEVVRQLKKPLNAKVILLHTLEPAPQMPIYGDYWTERLGEVMKQAQEQAVNEARKHLATLDPEAEHHLEVGHPLKVILRYAKKDIDLIAMGTHGADTLIERLLGSITERVIELSGKPVMATRAGIEVRPIRHILVSTALADPSKRALAFAKKIADALGARITLMHAVEPVAEPPVPIHMPDPSLNETRQAYIEELAKKLEELAAPYDARPLLKEAKPVDAICEVVPKEDVDAVFIGKSRQNRFMGSVTREVLERAQVPVFVHP